MVKPQLLAFAAVLSAATAGHAGTISAAVRVIDGDTLEIGEKIVRLADIDAPELGQKCDGPNALIGCGKLAADFLAERIEGQMVVCDVASMDHYGRSIASCVYEGEDIAGWLVREGYALAYVKFSDRYVADEADARAREAGLWRATVEPPWEYRAHRWNLAKQQAPEACPIKGNISQNNGDHIYHAPWSPYYERTRISVSNGERWFCSEGEALAAGWRPPRY